MKRSKMDLSISMNQYETVNHQLARAVGLQKTLKKRRTQLNQSIANCYQRFERNGGKYDGRSLVPLVPAWDLPRLVSKLGKVERQILTNRKLIQELTTRKIHMKKTKVLTDGGLILIALQNIGMGLFALLVGSCILMAFTLAFCMLFECLTGINLIHHIKEWLS